MGFRKLVHILHCDVMIYIIGQGGRTVFNQFSTQLFKRHWIKSMHLGIFGVNRGPSGDRWKTLYPFLGNRIVLGTDSATLPEATSPIRKKPASLQ